MTLQYADDGSVYDDGQPNFSWVDNHVEPLKITVTKAPPAWVDSTPIPLQNPDASPADIAAYRTARAVKGKRKLPVEDDRSSMIGPANPERPSYVMEPDLQEAQGGQQFPPGLMQNDAGQYYYADPTLNDPNYGPYAGQVVPMVRRPDLLPIANTPEGLKLVMPKMLDLASNVMGNVGGVMGGKVAAKAGEMVLGSGMVRKLPEKFSDLPEATKSFVNNNFDVYKVNKFFENPEQWYNKFLRKDKNWQRQIQENEEAVTKNPYLVDAYHGNPNEFKGEELKQSTNSFASTKSPRLAEEYAVRNHNYGEESPNIIPLKIDTSNYHVFDAKGGHYEDVNANAIREAKKLDKKGVIINNVLDEPTGGTRLGPQTVYHTFDRGTVRSKFAKFNPEDFGKNGLLLSDTRNQVAGQVGHQVEHQVNQQGFYSALQTAVSNAKVDKADASQWLGYLKNQPGVKSEELNYTLKNLPEGQISRSQLEDIVKQNKVELGEKVLGGENDITNLRNEYERLNPKPDKLSVSKKTLTGFNDKISPEYEQWIRDRDEWVDKSSKPTKYHSYQLPGGENYKEMLLTLPNKITEEEARKILQAKPNTKLTEQDLKWAEQYNPVQFKSSHWNEPNVLAHIRMNDRNVEGKKVLHIEELQSDWHQLGRKQGYKLSDSQKADLENIDNKLVNGLSEKDIGNPDMEAVLKTAVEKKVLTPEEAKNYKEYSKGENSTVPDAPFKRNWDELALKRIIRHAAENGYEGVSWTPGEAQAARYDLSKHVDKVNLVPQGSGLSLKGEPEFKYRIDAFKDNNKVIEHFAKDENEVASVVGKDVAEKLFANRNQHGASTLAGQDLKIGGEGMKSFYDKMLVDRANGLVKKYGSKVEQKKVDVGPQYKSLAHFMDWAKENYGEKYSRNQLGEFWKHGEQIPIVKEYVNSKKSTPIHYFPITPALRDKATKEGFPLFSSGPTLIPVDHSPQFEDKKSTKYKLTPVQGNPFQ